MKPSTRLSLNGSWQCEVPGHAPFTAQVPGCFDTYIEEKDIAAPVTFTRRFALAKTCAFYALRFGAVSYYCQVWLNGHKAGSHEGMWDAFTLDVTPLVQHGENELRVMVTKPGYNDDDAYPLRQVLSGFIPDVLCTFGGLWDDVCLLGAESFLLAHHFGRGAASGEGELCADVQVLRPGAYRLCANVTAPGGEAVCTLRGEAMELGAGTHTLALPLRVENPALWHPAAYRTGSLKGGEASPASPALYRYEMTLEGPGQTETAGKAFAFRTISAEGPRLLLNGAPVYPRGVLHWGCYDDAIIPRPAPKAIADEMRRCAQHGFNMVKHCLYIPREDTFRLADEMGMLLWVELPLWLPEATPQLEPRIRTEYPRILRQLAGHPSIVILSLGCELNDAVGAPILEEMYHLAHREGDALVRDNSGSGECYGGLAVDFADFFDYHFYGELQNMENLMEAFTPAWRGYRPWLYGEFCDSDTLRDLAPLRAARGVETLWWERQDAHRNPISRLKPDFYAGGHDEKMESSGIRAEFDLLCRLSYNHSMVHRKTTLEQTRAFAAVGGYVVTSIRDVAIATSGIFDTDMRDKFDAGRFAAFNADVVLLPAWDLGRVWIGADRVASRERYNFYAGEEHALHILLSNFGGSALSGFALRWQLAEEGGAAVLSGEASPAACIAHGEVKELHYLGFTLPNTANPAAYTLQVQATAGGRTVQNSWPVFVYPRQAAAPVALYDPCGLFPGLAAALPGSEVLDEAGLVALAPGRVLFTSLFTPAVRAFVQAGGRALCVQHGAGPLPTFAGPFWREGMLRACPHPALAGLLPDAAAQGELEDLRYFSLATDCSIDGGKMQALGFAPAAPLLLRYDCRQWLRTEYLAEYTLGAGRLMASTLRFGGGMGKQPAGVENSPFAAALLRRLAGYLQEAQP